jgi:hyaluronate lyase
MAMAVARTVRLLIVAALLQALSSGARADDFDTLRARFIENLTGGPELTVDPLIQAERAAIVQRAMDLLNPGNGGGLNDDGSFRGLRYDDPAAPSVRPRDLHSHFGRTLALARAYQVPGTALHHSAPLKAAIERAIRFGMGTHRYCGSAACVTGNWWEWRIGVPGNVTHLVLLMEGELPASLLDQLATHAEYHLRPVSVLDSPANTGQNLMWFSQIHLRMAVFRRDRSRADPIKAAVAKTCRIVREPQGDGIRPDRSFQQHHGVLYMAGYGALYAADIASYIRYTAGTSFALDAECVKSVVDFVLDGVAFSTHRGVFDPSVRGRDVNQKSPGRAPVDPFVQLATSAITRREELGATAKAMIAAGLTPSRMLAPAIRELDATMTRAAWPSGHRHYPDADFTVHRREDYYLSIKMFSTRTKSGEFANDAGRVNARQSDGRMVLMRSGKEWNGPANEGLWPAVDWTRMPGTTVEQTGRAASDEYGLSTEAFAGGTHDGQNGVSAMQLAAIDSTLRAKKSWFFLDDFVVFLSSDIASDSEFPVETVVTQWPLASAEVTVQTDDGRSLSLPTLERVQAARWFASEGLGYWFPEPTSVRVVLDARRGNWSALGLSSGDVSAPFLGLVLDHGSRVQGGSAAYAIALRGQDLSSWTASPPFAVVRNDASASAVDAVTAAGVVFWQPGSVSLFEGSTAVASDTPSVVWLGNDGPDLTVSIADPAQQEGTLTLSLEGSFLAAEALDPGVQVSLTESGAALRVERAGGLTHRVRLTRPAPEVLDAGGGDDETPAGDGDDADAGTDEGSARADAGAPVDTPDPGEPATGGSRVVGGCALHPAKAPLACGWLLVGLCALLPVRRGSFSPAKLPHSPRAAASASDRAGDTGWPRPCGRTRCARSRRGRRWCAPRAGT